MCIVASIPTEDGPYLLKNRDRNYRPNLRLFHLTWNGMETAVLTDMHTEWLEGMNEAGIAIVNSALAVDRDEKESKKRKEGKKTNDGKRILRGLKFNTPEEAIESLTTYRKGIKGHTFLATKDALWSIEAYPGYRPIITELDPTKLHVRTNHGHLYDGIGYKREDGEDYYSSHIRKRLAERVLSDVNSAEEIIKAIHTQIFEPLSPYNMVRRTDKMRTSSQLVLHPASGEVTVNVLREHLASFQVRDQRVDPEQPFKLQTQIIQL